MTYTSCPHHRAPTGNDPRARAARSTPMPARRRPSAPTVDFEGVPILYLPWISFPLSVRARAACCFPTSAAPASAASCSACPGTGTSRPTRTRPSRRPIYSSRGVDLGAEYRFLTAANSGTLDADLHAARSADDGLDRSYVRLIDRLSSARNTRIDTGTRERQRHRVLRGLHPGHAVAPARRSCRAASLVEHRDDIWNCAPRWSAFRPSMTRCRSTSARTSSCRA